MMHDQIAARAAPFWGFDASQLLLAARRENAVFRVQTANGNFALRLHRPGYRTKEELFSELQWMAAIEQGGIRAPRPIPAKSGELVLEFGDTLVDVLTWLPGRPIGAKGALHNISDPLVLCKQLGETMAQLHSISDAWVPSSAFTRPSWDTAGLLGDRPVWGPFWQNPDLNTQDRNDLDRMRGLAIGQMHLMGDILDYGLIHADLITENIMIDNGALAIIDFDDCGYGFRIFELATFLIRFVGHTDYAAMRDALLAGYANRSTVDTKSFDFFLMLRALTYLGWIIPRMSEPGGAARSILAVQTAMPLVRLYLAQHC